MPSSFAKRHFGAETTYNTYATTQSNAVVYTPTSGHCVRLLGYIVTSDTALTITLKVGTKTIARLYVAASSGANLASDIPVAYGSADETLNITSSGNGNIAISVWGYED